MDQLGREHSLSLSTWGAVAKATAPHHIKEGHYAFI